MRILADAKKIGENSQSVCENSHESHELFIVTPLFEFLKDCMAAIHCIFIQSLREEGGQAQERDRGQQ